MQPSAVLTGSYDTFENLWWPGLTFRSAKTEAFLQLIDYPRKGFMLDISH